MCAPDLLIPRWWIVVKPERRHCTIPKVGFGSRMSDRRLAGFFMRDFPGGLIPRSRLMPSQTYSGKTNILNKVRSIANDRKHFAKYIIQEILGTGGKRSNNPAEINNSSVVAHLGGALYEEPHVKIKNLMNRQYDLETKRRQQEEKAEHDLSIQSEIARCFKLSNDDQL